MLKGVGVCSSQDESHLSGADANSSHCARDCLTITGELRLPAILNVRQLSTICANGVGARESTGEEGDGL
jgi:hypothetical protein